MSSYITLHTVQAYQEMRLEEARQMQALQAAGIVRPTLWKRGMVRIGQLLILTGERLHKRYAPAICTGSEPYPPSVRKAGA